MKMKKAASLLMTTALAAAMLTGCGGGRTAEEPAQTAETPAAEESSTEAASAEETVPAESAEGEEAAEAPADPNAPDFFIGAMNVLQPLIDDGTLVVVSGQTDFTQCATVDWDNSKAQSRMDALLAGNYSDIEIDGVLSPNDGIARAIITSCENAGQPIPVVVTKDNAKEVFADDPDRMALLTD